VHPQSQYHPLAFSFCLDGGAAASVKGCRIRRFTIVGGKRDDVPSPRLRFRATIERSEADAGDENLRRNSQIISSIAVASHPPTRAT
jgi:hypothetical protein